MATEVCRECAGSVPIRGRLLEHDAGALFDATDAPRLDAACGELCPEHDALLRGQRDEQPARGLRVVRECDERLVDVTDVDVRPGEVAVAAVAAGADTVARRLER